MRPSPPLHAAALAFAAAFLCVVPDSRAQSPYETNHSKEWVWAGTGLSLCIAGFIGARYVDPLSPTQISALDKNDVNSFDRNSMQPYRDDHAGDSFLITSFALPLTLFARDDVRDDAGTVAAMWTEAVLWSEGLVFVTKSIAQRTRPYAYDPDAPMEKRTSRDARLSFFSGHTSMTATNSFFMARVFSDYSQDRNAEIAVWTGAVLFPALTGFFRVDSGHHFTTDVITGFVVGAAVGYLVPTLHRRDDSGVSVAPQSDSNSVGFTATFSF